MAINLAAEAPHIEEFGLEARQASRGKNGLGDWVIWLVLLVLVILVLLPFYDVLIVSFGSPAGSILPTTFNFEAYKYILGNSGVIRAFLVSVCVVLVGTFISLLMTTITAYALSRKGLPGKNVIMGFITFTMLFGGGLIPWYLVVRDLGLINSYWSLILPSAMNAFYMIIMLTFFREFPESLEESAKIDGANDWIILTRIVLPTAGPVLATIGLFYAVDRWNDWFTPMLFLTDPTKWPLQTFTQQLLTNASMVLQGTVGAGGASSVITSKIPIMTDSLKMAVIIVGIVPIILVYPFLQKYFTKGVMIGSIKG